MYSKIEKELQERWVFLPDLFNLLNEVILKELEEGCIIHGYNLNKICLTGDIGLIVDLEGKTERTISLLFEESEKKAPTINYKMKCKMVINKRNRL